MSISTSIRGNSPQPRWSIGPIRYLGNDAVYRVLTATLLDEGQYLASARTMYRVLAAAEQNAERRSQRVHPVYEKPELLATRAREVWSWDITKLKGPVRWSVCHLYVIIDIFSRYVVGWMVALRESAELPEQLIADSIAKQHIAPGKLTLRADRDTDLVGDLRTR